MQVRVFEPALCCNTGVCGPDTADDLVVFTADLAFVKSQNVDIERHNMANDPMAFVESSTAKSFLEVAGSDGLPLTTVDGITVMTGTYPTREQLLKFAGLSAGSAGSAVSAVSRAGSAAGSAAAPASATLLTMVDASSDANADAAPGNACGPSGCC